MEEVRRFLPEYPRQLTRTGPVPGLFQDVSRRLRGSTTILSLILRQAAGLYTPRSIAKERTVLPSISLQSPSPSPNSFPPPRRFSGIASSCISLSVPLSSLPPPLFASCSSAITAGFSVSQWRGDSSGTVAAHSLRVRSVCRVLGSARNDAWMLGGIGIGGGRKSSKKRHR